jgi:hypothetical protein
MSGLCSVTGTGTLPGELSGTLSGGTDSIEDGYWLCHGSPCGWRRRRGLS